jgi:hypothetical protein
MRTNKLWQLPVVGRLGVQHGLLVGWFLLVAALAVMLVPGPAGSANAPTSLADPQTVDFGGQNHCGIVVGIGALGGFGSGDASCVSVESGNDSQVNTRGFGDIGMQFQNSPVGAPISNVHVSNFLANNNSNNTIIGNQDLLINGNVGASAGLFGSAVAAAPDAPAAPEAPAVDPQVTALPVADPAPAPAQPASVDLGGQNHCGIVAGVGASSGGSGSGDTTCASVESGRDSQVNTRGFGDIGMQFQNSPVDAPITNVHVSNTGNNNSTNTIVGDNNTIINFNFGIHV